MHGHRARAGRAKLDAEPSHFIRPLLEDRHFGGEQLNELRYEQLLPGYGPLGIGTPKSLERHTLGSGMLIQNVEPVGARAHEERGADLGKQLKRSIEAGSLEESWGGRRRLGSKLPGVRDGRQRIGV
jgi:hypothetical protein